MAKQFQLRRGTTAEHGDFTGAVAEITMDTDKNTVVLHDGTTAGGFPLVSPDETIAITSRLTATESDLGLLADRAVSTIASSVLLNQLSLNESIIKDSIEIDDKTTADYTIDDIIQNSSSGIIYVCTADSASDDLLTNTDYFSIDTTNVLSVTGGNFTYTNGVDGNGYIRSSEQVTQSIDFSGVSDGLKYIGKKLDGTGYIFEDRKPSIGMYKKQFADDNRLVFDVESGKHYTTTGGELVTNGTFDVDTSGWVEVDADSIISYSEGKIKVETSGDAYGGASNSIGNVVAGTRVGFSWTLSDAVSLDPGRVYVQLRGTEGDKFLYLTSLGTNSFEAIAIGEEIQVHLKVVQDGDWALFDDISVYKIEPTIDQELSTPVSFLPNPVMVASETPMDIREDDELATNVMESLEVNRLSVTKGFDLGQKWVNVTNERAVGVTYKNETGKPIEVSIRGIYNDNEDVLSISVDGASSNYQSIASDIYHRFQTTVTVPSGSVYEVYSMTDIDAWEELL